MKRIPIILLLLAALPLRAADPVVENVSFSQAIDGSGLVTVSYDVGDADGDLLRIGLAVSSDGGVTWDVACDSLSGAVGEGIAPGPGKLVFWDLGAEHPGFFCDNLVVKVLAEDDTQPQGLAPILAGTFPMGSPDGQFGHQTDEIQHTVILTTSFLMSVTETTNEDFREMAQWAYDSGYCTVSGSILYDALDGSTRKLLELGTDDCEIDFSGGVFSCVNPGHPVKGVSWYGAAAYCDWRSLREGLVRAYDHGTWLCNGHQPYSAAGYRLPTEAEWEYACRAGTRTVFSTGDCLDAGTEANYHGGYPYADCPTGTIEDGTVPVGSYPANPWGLHDMHGNLWEWCNDWYDYDYGGDQTDPAGPATGSGRVLRGGVWDGMALDCRSASRFGAGPQYCFGFMGFRVVKTIPGD